MKQPSASVASVTSSRHASSDPGAPAAVHCAVCPPLVHCHLLVPSVPAHHHLFASSIPTQFHSFFRASSALSNQIPPSQLFVVGPHLPFSKVVSARSKNEPTAHPADSVAWQAPLTAAVSGRFSPDPCVQFGCAAAHTGLGTHTPWWRWYPTLQRPHEASSATSTEVQPVAFEPIFGAVQLSRVCAPAVHDQFQAPIVPLQLQFVSPSLPRHSHRCSAAVSSTSSNVPVAHPLTSLPQIPSILAQSEGEVSGSPVSHVFAAVPHAPSS